MKKIITSVVALMFLGSVSFAQEAAKKAEGKKAPKKEGAAETKPADSKMNPKNTAPKKAKTSKKTETTTETKAK